MIIHCPHSRLYMFRFETHVRHHTAHTERISVLCSTYTSIVTVTDILLSAGCVLPLILSVPLHCDLYPYTPHMHVCWQQTSTPVDHSPIRTGQLKAWPKMVGSDGIYVTQIWIARASSSQQQAAGSSNNKHTNGIQRRWIHMVYSGGPVMESAYSATCCLLLMLNDVPDRDRCTCFTAGHISVGHE